MPKDNRIKKVLLIGSGGIRVGQAAEFDYSGSQALKALREEDIQTVLINPNIATLQTSHDMADKLYIEPITPEFVEQVIALEHPDGLLLSFGGQTALNTGVALYDRGILKKHGVRVLGTPVEAVKATEDRDLFVKALSRVGASCAPSKTAQTREEARVIAADLGCPLMLRPAYILGGLGSSIVWRLKELDDAVHSALRQSPIGQVLVEKYLHHWKEVEYEVVRDKDDNCITVCNMENFDPLGIHTGDSIVVAPSQTMTNTEYHMLREASIRIVRSLGVVGECNIQFALDPRSPLFHVIEINARLSRSSALASKATGYPLAYVAAKLALGYSLNEISNKVTGVTKACFEPALDYLVVKVPKWELRKFAGVKASIGSQMKSIGEVMSVGRRFEEALQKAVRMLELGRELTEDSPVTTDPDTLRQELRFPTDRRLFFIMEALRVGFSIAEIHELSGIDPWFLEKLGNISRVDENIRSLRFADADFESRLRLAKEMGFSDSRIAGAMGTSPERIRLIRKHHKILPVVKQIDTLAAEYPAQTNYLYLTYNGSRDDISFDTAGQIFVIGAGPIRIGSSVEFDWCTMNCVWELRRKGYATTVLNCNPETVSTDYDMSDKLYFEELTLERVMDIVDKERPLGVIVSVGGQTSNNLAYPLSKRGVTLFGTFGSDIDSAEDRRKFSAILDRFKISQPPWKSFTTLQGAESFAAKTGYPVILRPSYVLSGSAMKVARDAAELRLYIDEATTLSRDHPVLLSKFISGAREVEVDGVCDGRRTFIGAVNEHIEDAGVHSGDATMVIPPITISADIRERILKYSRIIALELGVKGPFNIQFMVKGRNIYVIECNLRASRSMPFTSKTIGINLIKLAAGCMIGEPLPGGLETAMPAFFSVKMPMFSWSRFEGADPRLDVEMKSTGELACMGETFAEAFLKAAVATESGLPLALDQERGDRVRGSGLAFTAGIDAHVKRSLEQAGFNICELSSKNCRNAATEKAETSTSGSAAPGKTAIQTGNSGQKDSLLCSKRPEPPTSASPDMGSISSEITPDLIIDFTIPGNLRKRWAPLGIPVISDPNFLRALLESLKAEPILQARELKQYWRLAGMHTELKINKIESGTVIDHLPPTKAYDILEALHIKEKYPNSVVTMATNVRSDKYGLKDILKIEGQLLSEEEINRIREIAKRFTINLISDYERVKKITAG